MKGQASIELLITVGIFLVLTIPVVFLMLSYSSVKLENMEEMQARAIARKLGESVNEVFATCPAKKTLVIKIPNNVEHIEINKNEAVVKIREDEYSYPVLLSDANNTVVLLNYGENFRSTRRGVVPIEIKCERKLLGEYGYVLLMGVRVSG
ncbi:MAG: hypothetical protein QXY05_00280 [Candidatus Anstonellales archaeon]